jgi:methylmalonyl-CoA mutase cobalamin-binding subunit
LDAQELQLQLERSALELSQPVLIEEVLIPLVKTIGKQWEEGTLRVAHEHLASSIVRSFLANLQRTVVPSGTAPTIVITTPSRQYHEIGALIVAVTAASEGWRVLYLGPDLPSEEIAAIALLRGAKAVALSIVYPSDDPFIGSDLKKLRRLIGDEIFLLAGGRSAHSYEEDLRAVSAQLISDLSDLRKQLRKIRG